MEQKSREIKSGGFVLRVVQAQEADLIVRLLTSKGEKISAFARAGLKSRKRFGGALEPLNYIVFRATKKSDNQELYYLEEAQSRNDFSVMKADMDLLGAATYLTELVENGAHEGLEHVEIFNLYGAGLKALDSRALCAEGIVRQFEIKLLSLLGWLPGFQKCENCGRFSVPLTLNPDSGHVTCADCGKYTVAVSLEAQKVIKESLGTSISAGKLDKPAAECLARITHVLFRPHLGNKPLKSAQFMSSLRSFKKET